MSWLTTRPTARQLGRVAIVGLLVVALVATGCAKKKPITTDVPSQALLTGTGVTGTTIKLGVLTDRTGEYAPLGKAIEQGRNLFWADRKVCDRKIEFVTKDHGSKVPDAVAGYAAIKDDVLALHELLGQPEIEALSQNISSDRMLTGALSWSSALLDNPYLAIVGSTYDIDMLNAVDWLVTKKGVTKGDRIGHIYVEGAFGENGLAGSTAAAAAYGLDLRTYLVRAGATDLSAQVSQAKAAGVKAILLTTTTAQATGALSAISTSRLDIPIVASGMSYSASFNTNAAVKNTVLKNLYVTTFLAAYSSPGTGAAEVRTVLVARNGDAAAKNQYALFGYAQAQVMYKILTTACTNKDLTRTGLLKAFQSLKDLRTDKLVPVLDYTKAGAIPARQSYILKPSATAEGGLEQVADLFSAPSAATYTFKK
jgi:ABC-type branched-subunit amino acid transport system substrate-binding protein